METDKEKSIAIAEGNLKGKTIDKVRYMNDSIAKALGYKTAPLIVYFTDGTAITTETNSTEPDGSSLIYIGLGFVDKLNPSPI